MRDAGGSMRSASVVRAASASVRSEAASSAAADATDRSHDTNIINAAAVQRPLAERDETAIGVRAAAISIAWLGLIFSVANITCIRGTTLQVSQSALSKNRTN